MVIFILVFIIVRGDSFAKSCKRPGTSISAGQILGDRLSVLLLTGVLVY